MFSRILRASDGSDDAVRAAEAAAAIARCFRARLHVLHVFALLPPSPSPASPGGKPAIPAGASELPDRTRDVRAIVERWGEMSENVVGRRVEQVLTKQAVPYTFHQENGDPGSVIVEGAAREGFDLIVLGCRGLGAGLRRQLGSVSNWVSDHAPCPVLIVRHEKEVL